MTNSKSTRRALFTSALAMLMCVAMLVGTTFAWFTDTASTAVNKIQSGKLDVALEMKNPDHNVPGKETTDQEWISAEGKTLTFKTADNRETDKILWEPGCTYELPELRVVNKGNLALKYTISVTGVDGDSKLLEAIDFTVKVGNTEPVALANLSGILLPTEATATSTEKVQYSDSIVISGHMKEEADNEYQDKTIEGIAITVYATQYTYEYDSTDNTYDEIDLWDGTVATAGELAAATNDTTVTVSSAKLLAAVAQAVNNGNDYSGYTIKLTKHLNLANLPWTPIGEKKGTAFKGTFDGGYKTIGGLNVTAATAGKDDDGSELDGYGALFGAIEGGTVKNLTVEGKVSCDNAAGIVARMNGGTIENCTSNVTVNGVRKAGGIVCMTYTTGTTTCTIKSCTNNGNVNAVVDGTRFTNAAERASVGGIIGFVGTRVVNVDNCTNNGAIGSANSEYCGGIIGWVTSNTATVTNGTNNGSVTGKTNTAGIIGIVNKGSSATITSCTNNGTIDGKAGTTGNICTLNGSATVNLDGTTKSGSGTSF